MNLRPYRPLSFLLLLLIAGGGCRFIRVQDRGEEPTEGGGGGVAASLNYQLDRGEIGYSLSTNSSETYRSSATLGRALSQPEVISDKYTIRHPFTKEILEMPPTLKAQADEIIQRQISRQPE